LFSIKELNLTVNVIDLPHVTTDMESLNVDATFIEHWAKVGSWDEETIAAAHDIAQQITPLKISTVGRCHCEAGLLALLTDLPQDAPFIPDLFRRAESPLPDQTPVCFNPYVTFPS
jgi:hypothetical protein